MSGFEPLTETNSPVRLDLLETLAQTFGVPGSWVLIGATARDIALLRGNVLLSRRATVDTDIATVATDVASFDAELARLGAPSRAWQRRIVLGCQVDVVPFGPIENDGRVVLHDAELNVLGCAEAAATADLLELPSGRLLPVARLEAIAVLKLVAFQDRHPAAVKDADDLAVILRAAGLGHYGDAVWDDEQAMAAGDYDHELAAAYRLGRAGGQAFDADRAARVLSIAEVCRTPLLTVRNGARADLFDAWVEGFREGSR